MKSRACNTIIILVLTIIAICSCKKDDTSQAIIYTRTDYIGSWNGTQVTTSNNQTFICVITADSSISTNINMNNFANITGTTYGVVTAANVTIPRQTVSSVIIGGYGSMQNTSYITWHYYINNGTDSTVYTASFTK